MKALIVKICGMTGKTVHFVEDFVREARMSVEDLKRLVERIARGEWNFDE